MKDGEILPVPGPGETEGLGLAGTYHREVAASLARVWENVFDWEHLPALHADSFGPVELIASGSWGWRVRIHAHAGDTGRNQVVELRAARSDGRYCATTLEGPGAGSEVHTRLTAISAARTSVEVAFHARAATAERLAKIGSRYRSLYARLWDEDEAMMIARERTLAARTRQTARRPRARRLGEFQAVRAKLPLTVTFGGERFRVVEVEGALIAHAVTCPHWFGPLGEAPLVDGCVRCPWHGYVFDVLTGRSVDGRSLRLATPPRVLIREGQVHLVPAEPA